MKLRTLLFLSCMGLCQTLSAQTEQTILVNADPAQKDTTIVVSPGQGQPNINIAITLNSPNPDEKKKEKPKKPVPPVKEPHRVESPEFVKGGTHFLQIKAITLENTCTKLEMVATRPSPDCKSVLLNQYACIVAGEKVYMLKECKGIRKRPEVPSYFPRDGKLEFTLWFDAIPRNINTIDFYNCTSSQNDNADEDDRIKEDWYFKGIRIWPDLPKEEDEE